jgi:predicted unusual protein kinase regulating ubiquinone biosynthesis (AarF/ABC1/UbiB family)
MIVLEGIGKQLDPDINLLQEAVPYLIRKETNDWLVEARGYLRPYLRPAYEHLSHLV